MPDKPSAGGGLPPPRFLIDALWFRTFVGRQLIARYMRWTFESAPPVWDPPDGKARAAALEPAIFVSWHANILTLPILVPDPANLSAMISPHPDGVMGAVASRTYGIEVIAATGRSEKQTEDTGGVAGVRILLRRLAAGKSIYIAGEQPPIPGRHLARGSLALARLSGRPIIPVASANARRKIIERLWDKMQIPLPNGHYVVAMGEPVHVDRTTNEDEAAALLKERLDECYARALRLADEGKR